MAKEEAKKESGGKKPKLKLHGIMTHKADDGTYVHEHHYVGKNGEHHPPRFGGTSSNMKDLHDHMDDHFGDQAESNDEENGPQPDATQPDSAPAIPGE
jgi:hypothetical protein